MIAKLFKYLSWLYSPFLLNRKQNFEANWNIQELYTDSEYNGYNKINFYFSGNMWDFFRSRQNEVNGLIKKMIYGFCFPNDCNLSVIYLQTFIKLITKIKVNFIIFSNFIKFWKSEEDRVKRIVRKILSKSFICIMIHDSW